MVALDTVMQARQQIARIAIEAFEKHELTKKVDAGVLKWWRFGRKGSSVYAFEVIICAGTIVFTGDVGDAILKFYGTGTGSVEDGLAWLRGAVNSPEYLFEKLRPQPVARFYVGDAVAYAEDLGAGEDADEDAKRFAAEVHVDAHAGDLTEQRFRELVDEFNIDDAHDAGNGFDAAQWWMREALASFMRAINAAV